MNEGNFILLNGLFVPMGEYRISLQESDGFLFFEMGTWITSGLPETILYQSVPVQPYGEMQL